MLGYIAVFLGSLWIILGVIVAIIIAYKKKQFENIEQAKYEMLEDDS